MAPMKRKAVTDERPKKRVKQSGLGETQKQPKSELNTTSKPAAKSVLQSEERAFPRGGAGVLTTIEKKQIEAQAERDVLYEEQGIQVEPTGDNDAQLFDDPAVLSHKKQRSKGRAANFSSKKKSEGSGTRIQGLSYKSLAVGSSVLGRVTAITSRDIALTLPNNLTGYVPITAISDKLNDRIDKLLADDGKQDATMVEGDDDAEDIDLNKLFFIGQWLRATVTATKAESADKSKKHITLSIDPAHVNGGLNEDSFVTNCAIQASVRSVEDHGLVMNLGLSNAAVRGFVSKKELGSVYTLEQVQEGQVFLCLVTGRGSNGQVLKLSPDPNKFSIIQPGTKQPVVTDAPSVDAFLPGTAVDVLVSDVVARGVAGKIMGMLGVTADIVHAGGSIQDLTLKPGAKIKARIIFSLTQDDGSRHIGISMREHILALLPPPSKLHIAATSKMKQQAVALDKTRSLSSIVAEAEVVKVFSDQGLYLNLGNGDAAFAHISQISDSRVESLSGTSGPYKPESKHKARIIGYNSVDSMYYVSLKQSVLQQTFLRLEDVSIGQLVKGTVEKLILGSKGVTGILVKLSDNVTGLVPEMHLSDTLLQHPERKYREGFPVKCRVLAIDLEKRHLRLTLKKSALDNDTSTLWQRYEGLEPGMESDGTIINLLSNGAVVQFFGSVRAWLPVAEMSDTFIDKPETHFRLGQTVKVRIVSVAPETEEMKVTCKDHTLDVSAEQTWQEIATGMLVSGTVSEKTAESISVLLENGLKGLLRIGHLVDGSQAKADKELKRIRMGQKLSNMILLDKLDRSRTLLLSNKPSLIQDAKSGKLITSFQDVEEGMKVSGFVRNITADGVYIESANGIVGLLPKSQISLEQIGQQDFGMRKDQTIFAWISSIDPVRKRFLLSMRAQAVRDTGSSGTIDRVENPVDASIKSMSDFTLGRVTQARVASVKATQMNVRLADNIQGRIDVSEAFNNFDEIAHKAAPLQKFKSGDIISVKILGIHDARNHRFLPISHRQGKVPVFELSAKKSRLDDDDESLLTMATVKAGSTYPAFVNNHSDNCVWVNLSPSVRGRVSLMDLSDDAGQLQNVENRFRVGCALKVTVKSVDIFANKLDLTARQDASAGPLTIKDLKPGTVVPARVTKIFERSVHVQVADTISGAIPLVELVDDYDLANPAQYTKNDIVRAFVLAVDQPNKKVFLSLRPSKVLSSSLPVKDPCVMQGTQLKSGDIVRGFVKQVAERGLFVSLGARVDALVRISDLSDQFVKDWKSIFEVDQLVKGRVLSVDAATGQLLLSLKQSHVDGNYTPPLTINDLEAGTIVTGKVRKVEDFGAFIDIDNTHPRLSGLCHRSEIATRRVEDVRKIYSAGDVVKAKVLSVDVESRKISLGLKASYFKDELDDDFDMESNSNDEEEEEDDDKEVGGVAIDNDTLVSEAEGGVDLNRIQDLESEDAASEAELMDLDDGPAARSKGGLKTSGFDWTGGAFDEAMNGAISDSEAEDKPAKKRSRKPQIKEDLTGDLDKYGPRSVSDFERQLLGQPNNSGLWVQYMAFQLNLSEVQKAREVAERALRMIHIRESEEKANVWIAWLNLEVEYGDDDSVEDVFKRACQVQDSLEMHEKLASIYIDSGKNEKADTIFERIVANKTFRASPEVWINYANFLMDKAHQEDQARALLSRALQSIPTSEHRLLTAKFAALEFHSSRGDPERGRTLFEGLLAEWPKWSSGWDMWADLERSRISHGHAADREKVRDLYARMAELKMKKRRAKFVFKRWLEFEEQFGGEKEVERVKTVAREYAERLQSGGDDEE